MLYFYCSSPAAKFLSVKQVFWNIRLSRTENSLDERKESYNKGHENPITHQCLIIHGTSEHTVNTSLFCFICFHLRQKQFCHCENLKKVLLFRKINKELSRRYLSLAIDKIPQIVSSNPQSYKGIILADIYAVDVLFLISVVDRGFISRWKRQSYCLIYKWK